MHKTNDGLPVRIKDIAQRLGVSSVSVHRALAGKEGISEDLRKKILQTADEMGYRTNYAAASIKRKSSRIAVILPVDHPGKSYYFDYILKGVRTQAEEVRGLNVELEEFPCSDEEEQLARLRAVADAGTEKYAGVITYSFKRQPSVLMQLQRLVTLGIATVVIDDELPEPEGLCCITANEEATGAAIGGLISLITPEKGTVLVSGGRQDYEIHQNKIRSLTEVLAREKPELRVVTAGGYVQWADIENTNYPVFCKALRENPDTVAVCAITSHDNVPMERAVRDMGLRSRLRFVAIDLNELTAGMLEEDRIDAVVNQAAFMKGYHALGIVTDSVVKHLPLPARSECTIDIVLKGNLGSYKRRFYKERKKGGNRS